MLTVEAEISQLKTQLQSESLTIEEVQELMYQLNFLHQFQDLESLPELVEE